MKRTDEVQQLLETYSYEAVLKCGYTNALAYTTLTVDIRATNIWIILD